MKNHPYFSITTLLALSVGCSLINSPEKLNDELVGSGGSVAGDGDGDGSGGASGDGDGTGGDIGFVPTAPTEGLIVLAGVLADTEPEAGDGVLSVLRARDGEELLRESLPAATVAYDERQFAWFVFTSSSVSPGANTLAELQVRYFDDTESKWVLGEKTAMLPPPLLAGDQGAAAGPARTAPFRPVVLNGRLAYVSQTVQMGNPVQSVTVLDTSNLDEIEVIESISLPPGEAIVGLVGRRGTELDPMAQGGSISVMAQRACGPLPISDRCLIARPATIGNSVSQLTPDDFGQFEGVPAFATTPVLSDAVNRPFQSDVDSLGGYAIAFDTVAGEPRWWKFDPANPSAKEDARSLDPGAGVMTRNFSGFAVSECLTAGITSDASDMGGLMAVHLANASVIPGTPARDDAGADIQVDPYEKNVIVVRSPGADWPTVRAFQIEQIGAPGAERVTATERGLWNAPEDIDTHSFALRRSEVPNCE